MYLHTYLSKSLRKWHILTVQWVCLVGRLRVTIIYPPPLQGMDGLRIHARGLCVVVIENVDRIVIHCQLLCYKVR